MKRDHAHEKPDSGSRWVKDRSHLKQRKDGEHGNLRDTQITFLDSDSRSSPSDTSRYRRLLTPPEDLVGSDQQLSSSLTWSVVDHVLDIQRNAWSQLEPERSMRYGINKSTFTFALSPSLLKGFCCMSALCVCTVALMERWRSASTYNVLHWSVFAVGSWISADNVR